MPLTIKQEYEQFKKDVPCHKLICKSYKVFVAKSKSWKKEFGVKTIKLPAESNVPVDVAKKNLAYALGFTNSGFSLSELKGKATNAEHFAANVYYTMPYEDGIDMTVELRAWLKPSYFSEIKLPLNELKLFVMQTWDDIYLFMEKYKLW